LSETGGACCPLLLLHSSRRRLTGGRKAIYQKKRKFELGRPAASTKLGAKRVHIVRVRAGAIKARGLRLDTGNFSWGSEVCTRRVRILDVVYNASNNELVRTKTLVKNAIIQVDATPFRQWYEQHYGAQLGKAGAAKKEEEAKKGHPGRKIASRRKGHELDAKLVEQFSAGRLLACIASRPGQVGRCDGYILEGKELEFYARKLQKKKAGAAKK